MVDELSRRIRVFAFALVCLSLCDPVYAQLQLRIRMTAAGVPSLPNYPGFRAERTRASDTPDGHKMSVTLVLLVDRNNVRMDVLNGSEEPVETVLFLSSGGVVHLDIPTRTYWRGDLPDPALRSDLPAPVVTHTKDRTQILGVDTERWHFDQKVVDVPQEVLDEDIPELDFLKGLSLASGDVWISSRVDDHAPRINAALTMGLPSYPADLLRRGIVMRQDVKIGKAEIHSEVLEIKEVESVDDKVYQIPPAFREIPPSEGRVT